MNLKSIGKFAIITFSSIFLYYIGMLRCEELIWIYGAMMVLICVWNEDFAKSFILYLPVNWKYFVCAIPFAIFIIFGSLLWEEESVVGLKVIDKIVAFVGMVIFFAILIKWCSGWIETYSFKVYTIKFFDTKICKLVVTIFIFSCWIPALLSNFPGILVSDSGWQWNMALGTTEISSHHPPAHTLLIRFSQIVSRLFSEEFNPTLAVCIYSIIQMVILATIYSYTIYFCYHIGIPAWALFLEIAFYALYPINAIFSIYMTKDILFSALVLLLTIFLYYIKQSQGDWIKRPKNFIFMLTVIFGLICFRSNGFFIAIFSSVCIVIYFKKIVQNYCIVILAILFSIVIGKVYSALDFASPDITESLGMPINQISNIVVEDKQISERDMDLINEVIPIERIKELYNPYYSDPIKFSSEFHSNIITDNAKEYLGLWIRCLIKYPVSALEATANLTIGYWYPGISKGAVSYDVENKYATIDEIGASSKSILFSDNLYDSFIGTKIRGNYFFSWMFSIGNVVFFCMFCGIHFWLRKKFDSILVLIPNIMVWCSLILATPSYCETRYVYSLFLCIPVYLTLLLNTGRRKDDDEQNCGIDSML